MKEKVTIEDEEKVETTDLPGVRNLKKKRNLNGKIIYFVKQQLLNHSVSVFS